jgi:prepilin-type N-terminal cleavage/methylation domain-containing protein
MLSRTGDEGFTLVELLISVAIMGTVLSAVSGITLVAIKTVAGADTRLTESNDLMRATRYFSGDVQSAKTVSISTIPKCGTDSRAVVEFVGQDVADAATPPVMPPVTPVATTTVVSYVQRTVTDTTGTRLELHRLTCAAPTITPVYPLTPVTDIPVVRWLSATAPTATCVPSTCAAVTQVNLVVREKSGGLVYTLTGRRRTS